MDSKIVLIFVAVCVALVLGNPVPRADLAEDKERAQYGVVKLNSETNIVRMRTYILVIEINHTVKKLNKQLFTKMQAALVPEANLESLRTEMRTKTNSINNAMFRVMDQANSLVDHLYSTNNHIVNVPSSLATDQTLLQSLINSLQIAYDGARDNLDLTKQYLKLKVQMELQGKTGAAVDEAWSLVSQIESLLDSERQQCDEAKIAIDTTSSITKTALQTFIDLHVV